ncbi:ArsR/SmtB family transcription factor [Ornithinicoccus hortensis]|uniref:ArsR family transcriptional regulator n=1 Tax=Ornithinicoccus hortensis TaxID=82346 RepID=A0A542YUJ9_9MICO|nr:metalloregulator ArsR/SmtB family transcription factor [Ornithinicoccus hortensis]TQL51757.1 ArsR family transcriptional regulator [Ornithinicoccus hortensis]
MSTSVRTADLTASAACAAGCVPAEGLPRAQAEQLAGLLKALADPVRLRLYSRIAATAGETCVCDLGDFGVSQPTISHHLRKLREAGLIESERRGTWVYYRAVPAALSPLTPLLNG